MKCWRFFSAIRKDSLHSVSDVWKSQPLIPQVCHLFKISFGDCSCVKKKKTSQILTHWLCATLRISQFTRWEIPFPNVLPFLLILSRIVTSYYKLVTKTSWCRDLFITNHCVLPLRVLWIFNIHAKRKKNHSYPWYRALDSEFHDQLLLDDPIVVFSKKKKRKKKKEKGKGKEKKRQNKKNKF